MSLCVDTRCIPVWKGGGTKDNLGILLLTTVATPFGRSVRSRALLINVALTTLLRTTYGALLHLVVCGKGIEWAGWLAGWW